MLVGASSSMRLLHTGVAIGALLSKTICAELLTDVPDGIPCRGATWNVK